MHARLSLVLCLLATSFAGLGCDRLRRERTEATSSSSAAASAESEPEEPPNPDDAFFTTGKKASSLYRVRDGKVTPITLAPECGSIGRLVVDGSGVAWLGCYQAIYRVNGTKVVKVDTPTKFPSLQLGRDGKVWLTSHTPKSVYERVGDGWREHPMPASISSASTNLVVEKTGKPWLSAGGVVFVEEGGAWKPAPLGDKTPSASHPSELVATDHGVVYVEIETGGGALKPGGSNNFVAFKDGKATSETLPNYTPPLPRPGGGIVVADHGNGSYRVVDASGKTERTVVPGSKAFEYRYGGKLTDDGFTTDASGRLWIGTEFGMIVVEADGSLEQWEPGRVEGMVGYIVEHVAVAGKGPTLPKLLPKVRGEVKGKIATDKPVKVELCGGGTGGYSNTGGATWNYSGATPCSSMPLVRGATTDKDGNFVLKDVPPYGMGFVFQTSPTSWEKRKIDCCLDLKAGQLHDLGQL